MAKVPRFRTVDPWSLAGGGPEFSEMIHLSTKWWIIIKFITLWFRHRIIALLAFLFIFTGITDGWDWWPLLRNYTIVLSVMVTFLYGYTFFKYTYAPNPWRLTKAIRRRWFTHKRWPEASQAAGFKKPPRMFRVRYTPNGIIAKVLTDEGTTSTEFRNHAEEVAAVLKAHEVKVDATVPFEAEVNIIWGDPTRRILYPEDITEVQSKEQGKITFALDQDHHPIELSITTSLLIVGESESGKSNCFWSILNGLNEKEIPYRLHVIDPAGGVELSNLETSPNTVNYVGRAGKEADALVERVKSSMLQRLDEIKAKDLRKYEIGEEHPLNILVVDELLLLSRYDQHTPFGEILSSGRKAGYIVIALSQLSQIDALGRTRDLFPQRICHATKSQDMTDAALGSGAEMAGARCSKIPKSTPGVGYLFQERSRLYTRFRTPLITDKSARLISKGLLIERNIAGNKIKRTDRFRRKKKTCLYRYYGYYGGEYGRLLYVGVAYDPIARWEQHRYDPDEEWTNNVDTDLTEWDEWYDDHKSALEAEKRAIETEHPVYNKQHRKD